MSSVEDPLVPIHMDIRRVRAYFERAEKGELARGLWEWYLDQLGFPTDSAVRDHIRSVFHHRQFDGKISQTFDHLASGRPGQKRVVSRTSAVIFSRAISGQMHILLRRNMRIPLCRVSEAEISWLRENFDLLFPRDGCTAACWSCKCRTCSDEHMQQDQGCTAQDRQGGRLHGSTQTQAGERAESWSSASSRA